jgi:predicted lipid-binding transport protein (Tim44 family)
MAEQHGGARTPRNPAPVSGPGQLSRRTDGGPQQTTVPMTGMAYGENADFNDMQSAAPMAAAPSVSNTRTRNTSPTGQRAAATPLFSPTQRPDEPVTAGAPFGPGAGPSMPEMAPQDADMQMLKQYLPDLEVAADLQGAPKTFKMLVSYLRNA